MIELRIERCIYGPCSNITLNRGDMRSKFEYTTLYDLGPTPPVAAEGKGISLCPFDEGGVNND